MAPKRKKTWVVSLPITGVVYAEVQADSEAGAITAALDATEGYSVTDIEEFSLHRRVCEGNVFHGELNEAIAEEV